MTRVDSRCFDGTLGTRLLKISSISKNHSHLFTASSGIMHAAIDLSRCGARGVNTFADLI